MTTKLSKRQSFQILTFLATSPKILQKNIGCVFVNPLADKQAGTGPSRRHIQGSKIAKRLPSVKYSLLQYSKIENFSKKNGPSGALKSHNVEKLKGGTL